MLGTRGGLFKEGLVVAEKPMSAKLIMVFSIKVKAVFAKDSFGNRMYAI